MISKSAWNIFLHEFWWGFAPDFISIMNTNALHLCNSCLLPYEIHVHMERPVPIRERLLHAGSGVDCPLVPAESNQGNIWGWFGGVGLRWQKAHAPEPPKMGNCCELWSLTIIWETQNLFTQSYNTYFQGKKKAVSLYGWEDWEGKATG